MRRDDRDHLEGKRIGTVQIIEYVGYYKKDSVYAGRCDCGTIEHYRRQKLIRTHQKHGVMCSECQRAKRPEIYRQAFYDRENRIKSQQNEATL